MHLTLCVPPPFEIAAEYLRLEVQFFPKQKNFQIVHHVEVHPNFQPKKNSHDNHGFL